MKIPEIVTVPLSFDTLPKGPVHWVFSQNGKVAHIPGQPSLNLPQIRAWVKRVVTRAVTDYVLPCDYPEARQWALDWLEGKTYPRLYNNPDCGPDSGFVRMVYDAAWFYDTHQFEEALNLILVVDGWGALERQIADLHQTLRCRV